MDESIIKFSKMDVQILKLPYIINYENTNILFSFHWQCMFFFVVRATLDYGFKIAILRQ
jgi:hypothetical protein